MGVSRGQHLLMTEHSLIVTLEKTNFVLECKLSTDIRNRYIAIFYRNHPSMYKLITLINNENKNIVRNLAVFIQKLLLLLRFHICYLRTIHIFVYYRFVFHLMSEELFALDCVLRTPCIV